MVMMIKYKFRIFAIGILVSVFSVANYAQTFVPVNVTGFNHDLIANGSGGMNRAEATTTITFDDPATGTTSDNVLYSKNFRGNTNPSSEPPFGLPDDGIIPSLNLPGAVYHLASYDQNNALVLRAQGSSGTLTLETPGVFSKIAFLGASSNGSSSFDFVLNFSDGTSFSTSFTVPDWYFGSNYAIKTIGRVYRSSIGGHVADEFNGDAENPRLYDNQLAIDAPYNTKILTSFTITKTNASGSTGIFAINGITAINAPDAPIALTATNVSFGGFTANWSPAANATGYFIDVSTSPTFSTLLPAYNNLSVGNTTSVQITGIMGNQPYYYRVRAANISGVSPSSNTIIVDYSPCPTGQVVLSTQADVNQFLVNYPDCTELSNNLYIGVQSDNSDVSNLMPLSKIGKVGGYLVVYNTNLTTLNGLNNLTSIGQDIDIRNNNMLSDISALQNTTFSPFDGFGLTILNNPSLAVCDLPNFCTYLANPAATHPRTISGNAANCITEQAVIDACSGGPELPGDYCSNAISINSLFGHPIDEPQTSGTYTSEGMNNVNDPSFGHECFNDDLNTIWFSFTGDGNRYAVRSRDCSAKVYTDPNGAMYSGTCDDLTAINCHRDIWTGDVDPDINFRIIVQTEVGKTYYLMVEVTSTDDFVTYDKFGDFCLEVTRLGEECIVNIPDANFKTYLLENWEINTNFDDEIQCEEAESFLGGIKCPGLGIADMTGIQAFIKINYLDCSDNNLSAIDLSKNTYLEQLNCADNALSKLDLNSIPELWQLNCADNQLTALTLTLLYRLQEFDCSNNVLTSLDVSKSSILFTLNCSSNALAYLNLSNGNNNLLQAIDARNNPDLTCIQVDNADYSNTNWSAGAFFFDAQHEFNEYCEPPCQNAEEIKANYLFASSACVGENVHIIEYGIFTPIADSVSFQWNFGNGQTSTERDPIVSYSNTGTYKVSLRLENIDCPIEITKEIKINNCLKQADGTKISSIFPNPSSGHIQLKADLKKDCDALVNIYTLDQKLLYSKLFTSVSELRERISLSHKGMVIVEFVYPTGIEKHKVILLD